MKPYIFRYSGTIALQFVDEGVFFLFLIVIVPVTSPVTSPLGILTSKI